MSANKSISNLSHSELSQLIKKLDDIGYYLNNLMIEINEIKKNAKINTQQTLQPSSYKSLPSYQNNELPYYQDSSSYYNLNPDIVFK